MVRWVISFASVLLAATISLELLTDLHPPAANRINRPEEVVKFYEEQDCADQFVQMTELPKWDTGPMIIDTSPGVVESIPAEPVRTEELKINIKNNYYPLPNRVERLYEPVIDELRDQFMDEGHFNQIKLRPISFDGDQFEMGTTTFFNNFATNLSPDYDLFDDRTPRELLHPLVAHPDGSLRSLTETDLPYIAASAGMVIAKNGEAIFSIRDRALVIEGRNLGLSFGGSWDKDTVATKGVHAQIMKGLEEEREIPENMDCSIHYIGALRRFELLGKPDCFVVAITDGVPDWQVSREDAETVVIQLIPEGVTVNDIETLLKHIETVNKRISALLADSTYPPSPGLLYWLYILNQVNELETKPGN